MEASCGRRRTDDEGSSPCRCVGTNNWAWSGERHWNPRNWPELAFPPSGISPASAVESGCSGGYDAEPVCEFAVRASVSSIAPGQALPGRDRICGENRRVDCPVLSSNAAATPPSREVLALRPVRGSLDARPRTGPRNRTRPPAAARQRTASSGAGVQRNRVSPNRPSWNAIIKTAPCGVCFTSVRKWWNWQTHHLEGVAPKGVRVQIPPSAPLHSF